MHSVSDILLNYDSDKEVPLFGFGAKINGNINHCFALNFNEENPSVSGIEGIMNTYKSVLNEIDFSGPTRFSQLIEKVVLIAEESKVHQFNQEYFKLLVASKFQYSF